MMTVILSRADGEGSLNAQPLRNSRFFAALRRLRMTG
jgi:hypothetical protein